MSTEIKSNNASRVAWNKGRLVGQKRPLRPKEVWAIRVRLQIKRRKRDLAMFNLAIDSKLRGCDLVSLRVDDIASGGRVRDRATIVQHKTGCPVQFEITEQTRASLQDWLIVRPPDRGPCHQHRRLVRHDRPGRTLGLSADHHDLRAGRGDARASRHAEPGGVGQDRQPPD